MESLFGGGDRFVEYLVGVCKPDEHCLILRGSDEDAAIKQGMEKRRIGGRVAFGRFGEIADGLAF